MTRKRQDSCRQKVQVKSDELTSLLERTDPANDLRSRAEEIVRENTARKPKNLGALPPEETLRMLHELQVHQIEIEMQNEELRRAQAELYTERSRYFDLYDLAPVGYCTLSEEGLIVEANLTAANLFGVARSVLVKQPMNHLVFKEDHDILCRHINQIFKPGAQQAFDIRMVRNDSTVFWSNLTTATTVDADGNLGCRVTICDITERKRAEEALRLSEERYRELSIIDGLTQLYNSRHFYHQLRMEIDRADRYGQPLSLMLLDLDNFKRFNDTYGHIEGDQVLLRLGQVVKQCMRQTDTAYRYGGEEFTILLPMTTRSACVVTAERIRQEFKNETLSPIPGQDIHMTVSIGIAQYKKQEDMKAFVKRADQLMYQGKKNGKNRVCSEL